VVLNLSLNATCSQPACSRCPAQQLSFLNMSFLFLSHTGSSVMEFKLLQKLGKLVSLLAHRHHSMYNFRFVLVLTLFLFSSGRPWGSGTLLQDRNAVIFSHTMLYCFDVWAGLRRIEEIPNDSMPLIPIVGFLRLPCLSPFRMPPRLMNCAVPTNNSTYPYIHLTNFYRRLLSGS